MFSWIRSFLQRDVRSVLRRRAGKVDELVELGTRFVSADQPVTHTPCCTPVRAARWSSECSEYPGKMDELEELRVLARFCPCVTCRNAPANYERMMLRRALFDSCVPPPPEQALRKAAGEEQPPPDPEPEPEPLEPAAGSPEPVTSKYQNITQPAEERELVGV